MMNPSDPHSESAHPVAEATLPRRGIVRKLKSTVRNFFPSRDQIRSHKGALALCLISGLFGGLLFHHNVLGHLAWIALVPYFVALPRLSGKMLAWGTILFGFTWYYLGLWWLHTLIVFHWIIPLGVFIGVIYVSLYFLLFAYPAAWCARHLNPWLRPWAIAVCWVAVEYLRNFTDMAFPWNLLGHSQIPASPVMSALAATGGVSLISLLMVLINGAVATVISCHRSGRNLPQIFPVLTPPLLLTALVIGLFGFPQHEELETTKIKVSVIQPGVSQIVRWDAMMPLDGESPEAWSQRYQQAALQMQQTAGSLINEAARQDSPRLIVLPESPFLGSDFPYESYLHSDLADLARRTHADIFLGADNLINRKDYDTLVTRGQRFLRPGDISTTYPLPILPIITRDDGTTMPDFSARLPREAYATTVAAWHISRDDGMQPQIYNKMQLVPFGEMLPFVSGITMLRDALEAGGIAGAFKPGMENALFAVDGIQFGAVICFESTFPYLTRELALGGAQFICVLTNDSWYDPQYAINQGGFWGTLFRTPGLKQLASAGPRQHFIHSQLRAVETGLPVVRSANSGISTIIDHHGHPQQPLDYGSSGFLTGNVAAPPAMSPTAYVRWGDWVGGICTGLWLATVFMMFTGFLRKRKYLNRKTL